MPAALAFVVGSQLTPPLAARVSHPVAMLGGMVLAVAGVGLLTQAATADGPGLLRLAQDGRGALGILERDGRHPPKAVGPLGGHVAEAFVDEAREVTADPQQENRISHGQTVLVRELQGDEGDWVKLMNRRRELIAVTLDLFDAAGGRVQVEGALRAVDRVVVPSS